MLSLARHSSDKYESLSPFYQASSADEQPAASSELLQELQEVRDEASATKEQLHTYKQSCSKLQEELNVCDCLFKFILLVRVFLMFGEINKHALFLLGHNCDNRETTGATSKGRNNNFILLSLYFYKQSLLRVKCLNFVPLGIIWRPRGGRGVWAPAGLNGGSEWGSCHQRGAEQLQGELREAAGAAAGTEPDN